jgi:hypothetical protein
MLARDASSILVADAAQHLGGAVDDRLDQPSITAAGCAAAAAGLGDAVEEDVEGAGLVIAHRDQRLLGQDEGDVGQLRDVGLRLADDAGRHVMGAVSV